MPEFDHGKGVGTLVTKKKQGSTNLFPPFSKNCPEKQF